MNTATTQTDNRAPSGGTDGVNGYFYKGGQFLPSTDAAPGKWKLKGKWVKSCKEFVAPKEWSQQPTPFSRSIFAMVMAWAVMSDGVLSLRQGVRSYDGSPITSETMIRPGVKGVLGKEEISLGDLVAAWNGGQRWFDVQPDALTITTAAAL